MSLQVSSLTTQIPKVTKRSLQGVGCLEEEAKVCFVVAKAEASAHKQ
jgi:hypothetical protein